MEKIIKEDTTNQNEEKSLQPYRGLKIYEGIATVENPKLDRKGNKKHIRAIAVGLALLAGLTVAAISCNPPKNTTPITIETPTPRPTVTPKPTPTVAPTPSLEEKKNEVFTILKEIQNMEATGDQTSKELLEKETEMLNLAKEIESSLSDAEKAEILLVLDDNYARGMNQVDGMQLSEEEGLVAVSYLNGLAPVETGLDTEDIILDFIIDYETYWNKLNYEAKKYIGAEIPCKDINYADLGDLISPYVLNEKDSIVINHFIEERLKVNKEAHAGNYDKAYEMARVLIEQDVKMYVSNQDIKIDNIKYNVNTLSPWAQYLISFMAYADTGYLKDKAHITEINGCEIINGSYDSVAYHYNSDKAFIMQDDARNNINWYLEANSINATKEFEAKQQKKLCK